MARQTPRYNEPLPRPRGDRVPRVPTVGPRRLERVVRARLELERSLRECANGPTRRPLSLTAAHRTALLAILSETDSPLAASLRARAAAVVGPMKLEQAAPALRRMVLDEGDDLQTRLNAAGSYLTIRGRAAVRDIPLLLRSREPAVRAAVYLGALRSPVSQLVEAARGRFVKESDARVRAMVSRRLPGLSLAQATQADR